MCMSRVNHYVIVTRQYPGTASLTISAQRPFSRQFAILNSPVGAIYKENITFLTANFANSLKKRDYHMPAHDLLPN